MSRFSGKCDLYDHISGRGGWYDEDGNKISFGQSGVSVCYSDEMRDFEAFKKATGGVIYQHKKIEVTERNRDFVKAHCERFDYRESAAEGKRKPACVYTYWSKEYSLKELNKRGVYITVAIPFETILDIIPYYPYIVASASYSDGKAYVVVSRRSFVDEEAEELMEYGLEPSLAVRYKAELQRHYMEVCSRYLLKDYDSRVIEVPLSRDRLSEAQAADGEGYEYAMRLPEKADTSHTPEFVWDDGKIHSHWCGPRLADGTGHGAAGALLYISDKDVNGYLSEDIEAGKVKIRYVKALPEDYIYVK